MPDSQQAQREAEVAALIARANDPADPYDGHHGTDRSEDSLEYAIANNPEVAAKIKARLAAAESNT